jgi:phage tail-like protein
MTEERRDPFVGARFLVEIDGVAAGGSAAAVTFPESRLVRQGSAATVQYGPLVLQRGLTANADWYACWDAARRSAGPYRRTVRVVLLDAQGAPGWRWVFSNSEPIAYRVSSLDAMASGPVFETLELSVSAFEAFAGPG